MPAALGRALVAMVRAAWTWCRWPRSVGRAPGRGGRVCVCVAWSPVFVIRVTNTQDRVAWCVIRAPWCVPGGHLVAVPGARALVRDPWPVGRAAWAASPVACGLAR